MAIFYTDSASFDNVTINQNLTVLGTSSATYTENLVVESNTIKLGNNQVLRYAGVEFVDSGSSPITSASLLFDSTNNQIIYQHNGGLTSSVFLLGPETYNNLGNETYLTTNRLPKGTGIEHLVDSNITDTGTLVSVLGPLSASGGITGSGFFGTASHAVSASYAPGGGGVTINNNTNNYVLTATGTDNTINGEVGLTFDGLDLTVSRSLFANQVVSDNLTVNGPADFGTFQTNGSASFEAEALFNAGAQISGDAGFTGSVIMSGSLNVTGSTILSGSTKVTGSLNVTQGITGSLLGTSSWAVSASWAPAGEAAGFPFAGDAVITGSLLVTGSALFGKVISVSDLDPTNPESVYISASNINALHAHANLNTYVQLAIMNDNAGTNASADIVATNNAGSETGNYIDMGINSTTYTGGIVGGANDGYLYLTSSVGELHIGNASTGASSSLRLFTGGPSSDANTRMYISSSGRIGINTTQPIADFHVSGSVHSVNQTVMSSGSVTASGSPTVTLNMQNANYFYVSASGTGTVTWAASNVIAAPNVQAFILEYTGGGQKTNNWFTNTRWPGGAAPTLSSTGVDLLGFITDDAGSNWRAALLQRNSS